MLLGACLLAMLAGCSINAPRVADIAALAPLEDGQTRLTVADVATRITSPDLLALDEDMREFVQRYTQGLPRGRPRMMSLHRAVRGPATLGVSYDPAAEGSAREVFHRGSANCLSYATLYIALAREAGLKAEYQWLEVRPQWTRQGERVMVRLHVNALVTAGRRNQFMVDIDPLPTRQIAGSRVLSDADALALHHANIAMYALAEQRIGEAWLQSVRALQLSPALAQLWVNIGAVYRSAGQHRDAEASYLTALELDSGNDSAMNNLVVLYSIEGRDEDREHWEARVAGYRDANPYYHAWRGDQAAEEGDWLSAQNYYEKAVALLPDDSRLLFALGITHVELDQPAQASSYIRQAIVHARLRSDIDAYELRLRRLEEG
ncbi:tetratricopeptide repeat protein [Gymnodinialimonas sp.]